MNMAQYAIARAYKQLLTKAETQRLTREEKSTRRILKVATERYAKDGK